MEEEEGHILPSPLMKPHQLGGGGFGKEAVWRRRSSFGIPFRPGAGVGQRENPAAAMRPVGVGEGSSHGTARVDGRRVSRRAMTSDDMLPMDWGRKKRGWIYQWEYEGL